MSVIAKFYVSDVKKAEGTSAAAEISLGAVCRGVENAGWASATPAGQIKFSSLNDKATEYFEPGQEYEVLFTKVAKPAPGDGHQVKPVKTKYGSYVCATCGAGPSFDIATYRYDTVPVEALDWSTHDDMFRKQ